MHHSRVHLVSIAQTHERAAIGAEVVELQLADKTVVGRLVLPGMPAYVPTREIVFYLGAPGHRSRNRIISDPLHRSVSKSSDGFDTIHPLRYPRLVLPYCIDQCRAAHNDHAVAHDGFRTHKIGNWARAGGLQCDRSASHSQSCSSCRLARPTID